MQFLQDFEFCFFPRTSQGLPNPLPGLLGASRCKIIEKPHTHSLGIPREMPRDPSGVQGTSLGPFHIRILITIMLPNGQPNGQPYSLIPSAEDGFMISFRNHYSDYTAKWAALWATLILYLFIVNLCTQSCNAHLCVQSYIANHCTMVYIVNTYIYINQFTSFSFFQNVCCIDTVPL